MIIYSTATSTVLYIIYGILNIRFGLWIGFWSALGSLAGLMALGKILKKYDR
jgi:hypothetical protein